ncbi:hypothetical protein A4H02_00715 [Fervidobacterium thailandense]|uniref:Uncharacterized protein n=1 Tax=Fervidobacterium thailandense TaxID=1008305 RepID=A0A1E3G505_9BACT|nr:hypothetical protein A4H02_00715 [Fervidobacterium thailandense]
MRLQNVSFLVFDSREKKFSGSFDLIDLEKIPDGILYAIKVGNRYMEKSLLGDPVWQRPLFGNRKIHVFKRQRKVINLSELSIWFSDRACDRSRLRLYRFIDRQIWFCIRLKSPQPVSVLALFFINDKLDDFFFWCPRLKLDHMSYLLTLESLYQVSKNYEFQNHSKSFLTVRVYVDGIKVATNSLEFVELNYVTLRVTRSQFFWYNRR